MAGARGSTVAVLALPGDGSPDPFLISPLDYHRRCLDLLSLTLDRVIQFCGGYNCDGVSGKRKDCYYVINYIQTECSLYSRVFKVDYSELSDWCDLFLKYVHGPIGDDATTSTSYSEDDCLELLRKVTLFLEHMLQALGPTNLRKVISATISSVNRMAESVQDLKVYMERRKFNMNAYKHKSSKYLQQVIDVLDKNQEDKQVKQLLLEIVGPRLNFSTDEADEDVVDTTPVKVRSPEVEPKVKTVEPKRPAKGMTRSHSQVDCRSPRPEVKLKPTKIPFLKDPGHCTPPLSPRLTPTMKSKLTPAYSKTSLLHASEEKIKPAILKSKTEGHISPGSNMASHSKVKASLQQWNAIIEQNTTDKTTSKLQPNPKLPDRTVSPIASDGAKTWPRLKSISSEKPAIIKPKPQLNSRSASQPMIKPLLKPKPKNYDVVAKNNLLTGTKSKFEIRQVNNAGVKPKPEIKPKPHRNTSVSSDSQLVAPTKPDHFREKSHSVSLPKSVFTDNDTQPRLAHQYFNLTI